MSVSSSSTHPVLPLRDIVVFPHMIVPLFVGREKSVRALEAVMKDDKQILLASQKDPSEDEPRAAGIFRVGVLANVLQLLKLPDGTVKVLVEGKNRVRITEFVANSAYFEASAETVAETENDASAIQALSRAVVEEFERYAKLNRNIPDEAVTAVAEDMAPAQARGYRRGSSGRQARGEAEAARAARRRRAARGHLRHDAGRDVGSAGREEDQEPGQEPDGADPARVLSQRADEGDPARAGRRRRGRGPRRRLRVRGAHREDQALQGGAGEGAGGAQEAPLHVADVRRGHRGAQLSRMDAVDPLGQEEPHQEGSRPRAGGPRRRSLRAGEGQGPHRRVPRGAVALRQAAWADPLPRRASRRGQDQPGQVRGQGHGARVHPHLARRRPGRGGDPRPPADLYRLDARQDHPVDEEGQDREPAHPARRGRQDGPGLPRRSGRAPCSRCSTPSRTRRSRIITWRWNTTSPT